MCCGSFGVVPSQSPKKSQVSLTFGQHKQDVAHIKYLWAIYLVKLDSIGVSVFVFIFLSLTESETNSNDNLMMRRAGLCRGSFITLSTV